MADPAVKDRFFSDLCRHLNSCPANDKVLILGSFTERVWRDMMARKGVLGRHGIGNCDDNGFCTEC